MQFRNDGQMTKIIRCIVIFFSFSSLLLLGRVLLSEWACDLILFRPTAGLKKYVSYVFDYTHGEGHHWNATLNTVPNFLPNVTRSGTPINDTYPSKLSNSTPQVQLQDILIPDSISKLLCPRAQARLTASVVAKGCLFDMFGVKHFSASKQWLSKRLIVYRCSHISPGCGGLGDRMQGIFSVFLHAI